MGIKLVGVHVVGGGKELAPGAAVWALQIWKEFQKCARVYYLRVCMYMARTYIYNGPDLPVKTGEGMR